MPLIVLAVPITFSNIYMRPAARFSGLPTREALKVWQASLMDLLLLLLLFLFCVVTPAPGACDMQGKSVVVVGGGKTAIDVAVVAGSVAVSTALVARKGHWWAPQTVLGEQHLGRWE